MYCFGYDIQFSTAPPQIKLNISGRHNGLEIKLEDFIDLNNVGTFKDQLNFGLIYRSVIRHPHMMLKLMTKTTHPASIVRDFIDQILNVYFDIHT
jgi:hypothetical protein